MNGDWLLFQISHCHLIYVLDCQFLVICFLMITIVAAFAAVEFRKVGLSGEHINLKTFENVVSVQKKGTH